MVGKTVSFSSDDRLFGGGGRDILNGLTGDDYLEGNAGNDTLEGGFGDDELLGGLGEDRLEGGPGNDKLSGGMDNDTLYGNAGNDELIGGKGDDVLDGGKGFDRYVSTPGDAALDEVGDGSDTIIDYREGGAKRGQIVFAGQDLVGTKTLADPGNPKLFTDATGIRYFFTGNAGSSGLLTVYLPGLRGDLRLQDFRSGDFGIVLPEVPPPDKVNVNGDNESNILGLLGAAFTKFFGLGGDDLIWLNLAEAEGWGGLGNDILRNGDGDQYLHGEEGNDILVASGGNDELYGGEDNDALQGGLDSDYLTGDAGNDVASGGAGDDVIEGGEGNDFLFGDLNLEAEGHGGTQAGTILDAAGQGWVISHNEGGGYYLTGFIGQLQPGGVDGGDVLDGGAGDDRIWAGGGDDLVLGGEGEDHASGDGGADTLFGGTGGDILWGDASTFEEGQFNSVAFTDHGNDFLDGEEGDDFLYGQGGADTLYGGEGDDELQGDQSDLDGIWHGDDYLDGGAGNDHLFGQGGADILFGGDGDDEVSGDDHTLAGNYHGNDFIDGGAGNDILNGGGGDDEIYGGDGNDNIAGDDARVATNQNGNDRLDGGAGDDGLFGLGGDDLLAGGSGADNLEGGEGDDQLEGGTGNDVLKGGAGRDTYVLNAGDGTDSITEEDNGNIIRFGEGVAAAGLTARLTAAAPGVLFLHYTAEDTVTIAKALTGAVTQFEFADGSAMSLRELLNHTLADDVAVTGTGGADQVHGGRGADTLNGLDGDDTLTGGAGDDLLRGGSGDDTYIYFQGEAGDDGADLIVDTAGNDTLLVSGVNPGDVTYEQDGKSLRVVMNAGASGILLAQAVLDPESRIERVVFDDGTELAFDEMLAAASEVPSLGGVLSGTPGPDVLTGGAGKDVIFGLDGADTLDGAGGDDFLDGGTGSDTYLQSAGEDTIEDADASPNLDRLVLAAGVTPLTVSVGVHAGTGRLILYTSAGNVALPNSIDEADTVNLIERVEFADGTVWGPSDLLDRANLEIFGGDGADTFFGTDVNDRILGRFGDDYLAGGKRRDQLYGAEGDDTLDGGPGDDYLVGGGGRDTLLGGDGFDQLLDDAGANTFEGGRGNDLLRGSQFDHDVYRFNLGDGQDVLIDRATPYAPNRIVLGTGITPGMLHFDGAFLHVGDAGDRIELVWTGLEGGHPGSVVGEFAFEDGTVLSYPELLAATLMLPPVGTPTEGSDFLRGGAAADAIDGLGGNDSIVGQGGDDTLAGGAGDDTLFGGDGADVLAGGAGNDTLQGERGGDTYLFGRGAGEDVLFENDPDPANVDTVRFGPDVIPAELDILRDDRNVYITLAGGADRLTILGWGDGQAHRIERFEFADGTVWTGEQLIDRSAFGVPDLVINGTAGADVLMGGAGNDTLRGGAGNDVLDGGTGDDRLEGGTGDDAYVFGRGYGHDVAVDADPAAGNEDAVWLAFGIAPEEVTLTRDDTNVYLALPDGEQLTLANWMLGEADRIETIRFAMGTGVVWDSAEILDRAIPLPPPGEGLNGTAGDDVLFGTFQDDAMHGYAGQDIIYGNEGHDTIDGGSGDDTLYGGTENDALYGGDGNDALYGEDGDDTLDGGAGADVLEGGAGADSLTGGAGADVLRGGAGGDTYHFGPGAGADVLFDPDATAGVIDRVVLEGGLTPAQVTAVRSLDDLVLTVDGTGDRLTVAAWFIGAAYRVERFEFADGTVWTADAVTAMFPPPAPSEGDDALRGTEDADVIDALGGRDTVYGFGGDDSLAGGAGSDLLLGGAGDDVLLGGADADSLLGDAGADTLDGGAEGDYLQGGAGHDVYLLRRGEGGDTLSQYGALASDADVVRFVDAASTELALERNYHDLSLQLDGQTFTLSGIYDLAVTGGLHFEFQDAVVWTLAEATARATFIEPPGHAFYGTPEDDSIVGGEGADTIELYEKNDYGYGGLGADLLLGGPGSDRLYGEGGDDTLDGGEYGAEFGVARDVLEGGTGNDTYIMRPSTDEDTIVEYDATAGNIDTLAITGGVLPAETFLRRDGNDLVVALYHPVSPTGTVTLFNWWLDEAYQVERISFDDGTVWDTAAIVARFTVASEGNDQLDGGSGNDTIDGLGGNDLLSGKGGDDVLIGGAGEDTLDGGAGADQLFGGADFDQLAGGAGDDQLDGGPGYDFVNGGPGSDRYAFGRGSEQEYVTDGGTGVGEIDEVRFNTDVLTTDLRVTRNAANLLVNINGAPDQLILADWFAGAGSFIERFSFADGTVWDAAALESRLVLNAATAGGDTIFGSRGADTIDGLGGSDFLYGFEGDDTLFGNLGNDTLNGDAGNDTLKGDAGADSLFGGAGNDTLDGGAGNDVLQGQGGDDTYVLVRGMGADFASDNDPAAGAGSRDRVLVGPGVTPAQLLVTRNGNALDLAIAGTADKLTLGSWFLGARYLIEEVQFDDGTVWGTAELLARLLVPSEGNDTLFGTSYDDRIDALGGDDQVSGDAGNDTLDGGTGNDVLFGGAGHDVLRGGAGADVLYGDDGDDVYDGGSGDDAFFDNAGDETYVLAPGGGRDTVQDLAGTNRVLFAAGVTPADTAFSVEGGDLIVELKYTGDALRLIGWVVAPTVQRFEYADGLALDIDAVRQLVLDDPHDTGPVNNYFLTMASGEFGAAVDDPYDTAVEQLIVGDGLTPDDIRVFRSGSRLVVEIEGTGNRAVFFGWYDDARHRLDALRFADGTVWDRATIDAQVGADPGTPGRDILFGGNANDTINGGAGADDLYGGEGDDVLIGGDAGDFPARAPDPARTFGGHGLQWFETYGDLLDGGPGNDILQGSGGRDLLYGGPGDDLFNGGLGGDWLMGAEGNDAYVVNIGDGWPVTIFETDATAHPEFGDANRIRFGAGITPDSLTLRTGAADRYRRAQAADDGGFYDAADLVIGYHNPGTGDAYGAAPPPGGQHLVTRGEPYSELNHQPTFRGDIDEIIVKDGMLGRVQYFEFADGTVWDFAQIVSRLERSVDGTDGADTLSADAGSTRVRAGGGDDTVYGGDGGDDLSGDDGNDTLDGGAGTDYLQGGDGADVLRGGEHGDYLFGGAGDDTLDGGAGPDWIQGDAGADVLDGGAGDDRLDGGDGDDTVAGGDGNDRLQGDAVHTRIDTLSAQTVFYTLAGNDTLDGGAGDDRLDGLHGDDALFGGDGDDVLLGDAGNDLLDGGAGADLMFGGSGDDIYVVDEAGDTVREFATAFSAYTFSGLAGGHDLVRSSIAYALTDEVEDLTLTGTAAIDGTGNALANRIEGNAAANVLTGGAGNDTYVIDAADTVIESAGGGVDTVLADFTYALGSNLENLTLTGTTAIDGFGNALDNAFRGNVAANVFAGGGGSDVYHFGRGAGQDAVEDYSTQSGEVDAVAMAGDVAPAEVTVYRVGNDLQLGIAGTLDTLTLRHWFVDAASQVEQVRFNDGTIWDIAYLEAHAGEPGANEAPQLIHPLPDAAVSEDTALTFVVPADAFADPDAGDLLTYTAQSADGAAVPAWLTFDPLTRTFTGTPGNTEVGTVSLRVTATDSGGLTASDTFDLTVTNVNDAPTLATALTDQSATEDAAFSFTLPAGSFTDVDAGDVLTYAATRADGSALPAWLSFNAATLAFSGTPSNAEVGSLGVKLTATDSTGAAVSDTFDLTVTNVNDAPVLATALADQSATEDAPFSFTVPASAFTDVDAGDTLAYAASLADGSALPGWLAFNTGSRTFSGTPVNADVGTLSVRVTATDGAGVSASDTFDLGVANTNDAPTVAAPLADQTTAEDAPFAFVIPAGAFADVDAGDMLTVAATLGDGSALPGWLGFNAATRTFEGTPGNAQVGTVSLRVTATDGTGASAADTFDLTVTNVNDAPVLATAIADQAATEDAAFSFTLPAATFADVDAGDTLAYSASLGSGAGLPAWLTFNPVTRSFAGTPANGDVGSLTLRVTATDAAGATATGSFNLSVANVNDAPVLAAPVADQSAVAGTGFSFQFAAGTFTDPDAGDSLSYTATLVAGGMLPAWLAFNAAARTFEGTPGTADAGELLVRLTATDTSGGAATDDFRLTVQGLTSGVTLIGTPGNDALLGGEGDDLLDGLAGADRLTGSAGNDTFQYARDGVWTGGFIAMNVGSPGNPGTNRTAAIAGKQRSFDVFLGGAGYDTLLGTASDDALFLDDQYSAFYANAKRGRLDSIERIAVGDGNDVVDLTSTLYAHGDVTIEGGAGNDVLWASSGNDVLYGEAGNDDLFGGAGHDFLAGGEGNDTLNGDRGNDLLQGGAGNDTLTDSAGANLLQAGAGNDTLTGGAGNELLIGGAGNDAINGGTGRDLIAFNRGDGLDTVTMTAMVESATAVSLGGGIGYGDLFLKKSGNNLTLETGTGEGLTFKDWYASASRRAVDRLQVVAEAMAGFDQAGADPLKDDKLETFDFKALVQKFDQARAANPAVNRWAVTNALLSAHLGGSDTEALGGDLAYRYGLTGTLAGIGIGSAQGILADSRFGSAAQELQPLAGLQEGLVKLG
ncbi:MAG: putative Ig domain-containing protein [Burkholderiales bacterium]